MWRKATHYRSASLAISTLPVILGCALLGATGARADVFDVTISPTASGVVVTGSGDIDTTVLTSQTAPIPAGPAIRGDVAGLRLATPGGVTEWTLWTGQPGNGPTSIGPGMDVIDATSSTGSPMTMGVNPDGAITFNLPTAYVSGTALSNTTMFAGQTLTSLGLTVGDNIWTYGPAGDQSTFSINVVPLPATFPLFATGLGGLGLLGWRRKRKARSLFA